MRLVVQMGHVGRPHPYGDGATWSVGTTGEQDFTRAAGLACVDLLHGRSGWEVVLIPADPGWPYPSTIGGDPDAYRGDAFVAVHCDGSTNPDRDGASFGYLTGGAGFARDVKARYLVRTGRPASWCEPDNYTSNLAGYYGNNLATKVGNTRACIFECGFLTNPADRAMLLGPSGPRNVALAIGDALGIETEDMMDWDQTIGPVQGEVDQTPYVPAALWRATYAWGAWNDRKLDALAAKVDALTVRFDALAGTLTTRQAALLAAIADVDDTDVTDEQVDRIADRVTAALPGYTVSIVPTAAPPA